MVFDRLSTLVDEVRAEFAPDPRVSVFEVEMQVGSGGITLQGVSSEPAAVEALHRRAALLDLGIAIHDAVTRLPHLRNGARAHAVVCSAVAPMMASPLISDTQVSQVVLGHRLLVLRQRGRWMQCRAEDGYIGWIHRGYLIPTGEIEARAWEIGTEGEACTSLGAEVHGPEGELMLRLPWGARVIRREDGSVLLPDGRTGQVVGETVTAAEMPRRFPLDGEAICSTASAWVGAPYLWGGVTQGGIDCSGLVQVLFRTHGHLLPRDSDQQAMVGEPVDPGRGWTNLRAGDVLFFAEEAHRITHVTLSLGGCGIIHASLGNGCVARNSLLGELEYEKELGRIFVRARRMIP